MIEQLTACLTRLARPEDLRKGYVEVRGRTGDFVRYPLLSVTLAMITNEWADIDHVAQVGDLASGVK